jgi:hypothetical protein
MATQIVMDGSGDSRHLFNPHNVKEVANAEQRFYELTKAGFIGRPLVRLRRSDRSTLPRKKLSSSRSWLAGSGHVQLSAVAAGHPLPPESGSNPLHQARRRKHPRGPILAALAEMAIARAAGAVRQEKLLRGRRKRERKAVQDPRRDLGERVRDRRTRSLAGWAVFHADRRAADRRRHARPEDCAGNMRRPGARCGSEVHSERLPFQASPSFRLTGDRVIDGTFISVAAVGPLAGRKSPSTKCANLTRVAS